MKMALFLDVVPCSLVDTASHPDGPCHDAVSTSETSVNAYQTTGRNIQEGSHIHSDEYTDVSITVSVVLTNE
jgi:hypothetical protein